MFRAVGPHQCSAAQKCHAMGSQTLRHYIVNTLYPKRQGVAMCAYRRLGINTTHHTYLWVLSSHLQQFVPDQQGVATGVQASWTIKYSPMV